MVTKNKPQAAICLVQVSVHSKYRFVDTG